MERKHHSKDVFPDSNRTIPFASGATVHFNLTDLKIKNTYPFSIRIHLWTTETQLKGTVSAPVNLPYKIKIREKDHAFVRSKKTNRIYRYNELERVMYLKQTHKEIDSTPLWKNLAEVMYDTSQLHIQD